MGNYDAKFNAYETAIKQQDSWKKMTKRQRAEQMGRYSVGLQHDEIKAAKKAAGKKFAKELAKERADKQKMYENLWEQLDNQKTKYTLTTDPAKVTAGTIDDMFGTGKSNPVLDGLNNDYRFLEGRSDYKRAIGDVLKRRPEVNAGTIDDMFGIGKTNDTLDAMGDYYRALENQGGGNKFIDFLKNNKKALLIGAGVLAVAGLATWAISKYNDKKAEEEVAAANAAAVPPEADVNIEVEDIELPVFPGIVLPDDDIVVPYRPGMQPGAEDETTPEGEDGTVPGAVVPTTPKGKDVEKEEDTDNVSDAEKQVKPSEVATKEYVVKPGDNVWNIAKKELEEELGRKPYNREIAVRTKEILEKNNLKYEADNYTVLIYPGGKLDIAS